MTSRPLRALAASLALAACAPDKPAPVDVVVLVFNETTRRYEPQRVKLTTIEDIVEMRGPVANIVGEAKFVISNDDPALANAGNDPEALRKAITKDEGTPVKVAWIESDGALVPADFHSLNIATTYYNFEHAFRFFESIGGLTTAAFGTPDVFYFPDFALGNQTMKDNAMFFSLIQGFMILPFDVLQQVPLAINGGVIGHEYSHRIFNHRVFNGEAFPTVYESWSSELSATPGMNLLKSLDEGIADVFGTGMTCNADLTLCNPNFIGQSLPKSYNEERRIDVPHCLNDGLRDALIGYPIDRFSSDGLEYYVGSVLSSAMWRASEDGALVNDLGQSEARKQMFQALYRALGGNTDGKTGLREMVRSNAGDQDRFRLDSSAGVGVLDLIVDSATDPKLKSALCSAFLDRFYLSLDDISRCPKTARSYGECPAQ